MNSTDSFDESPNDLSDSFHLSMTDPPDDDPAPDSEPGSPSGPPVRRGTSVNILRSGGGAILTTVLIFGLLKTLSPTSALYLFFWRDPIVPFATVLLFFWALYILLFKLRHIRREENAFAFDLLPQDQYQLVGIRDVQATLREINRMPSEDQRLLLVTRIGRALKSLRASGNTAETAGLLEYQAEIDLAASESTYAAVKVFIWAIPVIGFIGTVLGISVAIGNFGALVQQAQEVEAIKEGLGPVTGGLAVAFETTLLALVLSIAIMFFSTWVRTKEDDLHTRVEDYCVEHLLNKLSIGDDKLVAELNEAFSEAQEDALKRMADVIESALREVQQQQAELMGQLQAGMNQNREQSDEVLQSMLHELTGQQGMKLTELAQRLERGLKKLADTLESTTDFRPSDSRGDEIEELPSEIRAIATDTAATMGMPPQAATSAESNGDLAAMRSAMQEQVVELQETRRALASLSKSLENLATLAPFEEVMTRIQSALDALVPAIEELQKPRELRIIDSHKAVDS